MYIYIYIYIYIIWKQIICRHFLTSFKRSFGFLKVKWFKVFSSNILLNINHFLHIVK